MFFVFNIIEKIKKQLYYYKRFSQLSYALADEYKNFIAPEEQNNPLVMHRREDDEPRPRRRSHRRTRPLSSLDRPRKLRTKPPSSPDVPMGLETNVSRKKLRSFKEDSNNRIRKLNNRIREENPFGTLSRNKQALEDIEKQLQNDDESLSHFLSYRNTSGTSKAEAEAYLKSSEKITDGQGIFSRNLQIIAVIIFLIMLLVFAAGNYLNKKNPISPLLQGPDKPFTINFLDKNNTKFLSLTNQTENNIKIEDVSPVLFDALLALHGVLEIKYGDNPVKTKDGNLVTLDEAAVDTTSQDVGEKKKVSSSDCLLYSNLKQFDRSSCKYSYNNFLINNFASATENDNSFVSKIINSSDWLKNYLLEDWVKDNVDVSTFLNIYFNYVYYGYNSLGLHATVLKLFSVPANSLEPYQAIIIIKSIYDNNKDLYPKDEITYENIIDIMIKNGALSASDKPIILEQIKNFQAPVIQTTILNYFDYMFEEAYKYFRSVPVADVKSTFVTSLQNTAINSAVTQMKLKNIPNASVIISNKGDIATSFTISLNEEGKPVFYKEYPKIYVYNAIKPILYLSLFENKKDTVSVLLENKYQNLIFSKSRSLKFKSENGTSSGTPAASNTNAANASPETDTKANKIPIELLTKTNLDIVPANIRALFADRLYSIEKQYILSLNPEDYKATFKKLGINAEFETLDDLFNGNVGINLLDLSKFYDAISQNGIMHEYRVIELINTDVKFAETNYDISINPQFISVLNSLFLGKLENRSSRVTYNTIVDYNSAFAISPDYSISVWLGDMNNPSQVKDYTENVQAIMLELAAILQ